MDCARNLPPPPKGTVFFPGIIYVPLIRTDLAKVVFSWNSGKIKQMYFSSQDKYAGHTLGWVAAASYKKRYFCPFVLVFFFNKNMFFSLEKFSTNSLSAYNGEKKNGTGKRKIIFTHSLDNSPCVKVKLFPGEKYDTFAPLPPPPLISKFVQPFTPPHPFSICLFFHKNRSISYFILDFS